MPDRDDERTARTRQAAPGRPAAPRPTLPKRFYKAVEVVPHRDGGFQIHLDGKPVRTPRRHLLTLPTEALAIAVADEWTAQSGHIDPAAMPITKLANSAIDVVAAHAADLRAEIVRYAGGDLLLYRAAEPDGLVERQRRTWEPVVEWAERFLGGSLARSVGLVHTTQPEALLGRFYAYLAPLPPLRLAAAHMITTLTGSALLALALLERHVDGATAWRAAHVDEDWQAERWGTDAEAEARRARMWVDMAAACRVLDLVPG